jgi:lysophospholipase L1-like esterase
VRRALVAASLLAVLAVPSAGAARPHVTLITDSVAGALIWDAPAARIFARGFDADLELKSCRRLSTQSCPAGKEIPPNALQVIRAKGRSIGANVVVAVGYNDFPSAYARGIESVLAALRANGVQHVFWLTLRAARHPYVESNAAIYAAARRHRELAVLDWNRYARGHTSWFQPDGLHLTGAGAQALAAFMHAGVLRVLLAPPPIDVSIELPRTAIRPSFVLFVRASGGTAPYRFAVRGLPRGLRANAQGTIAGTPRSGSWTLHVAVVDAHGVHATAVLTVVVSRAQQVVARSGG